MRLREREEAEEFDRSRGEEEELFLGKISNSMERKKDDTFIRR